MSDTQTECEKHHVTPEAGLRLDRALADALPKLSRSRIKTLITNGFVSPGEATITDASYRVKPGDTFVVTVPQPAESLLEGEDIPLTVVYEDEALLIIDKPAGLTVHPGAGQPNGTLVNALIAHCGESLSGIGGVRRPGIVHRLDKDTSGLMVAAKTDAAHASLAGQFEAHSIDRAYRAFVWGTPIPLNGEIEGNIGRSRQNRTKMTVVRDNQGKTALTRYRTLSRFGRTVGLLECRLETGRTHQIRVHLTHIGHPILGDPAYGKSTAHRRSQISAATLDALEKLGRQALHAAELGFDHPISGERMNFQSTLPTDMQLLENCLNSDTFGQ
ncbi:MAG: RluA family pseudouridine synthase [Alphaproteobacteria bacterium]